MSAESTLADGRRAAEARMTDACTITRPAPASAATYDPVTMLTTPGTPVEVWSGPCRVVSVSVQVNNQGDAGDADLAVSRWRTDLPVLGTEGVQVDDVVNMTAAGADTALTGRTFIITTPSVGSALTARRLPCEATV